MREVYHNRERARKSTLTIHDMATGGAALSQYSHSNPWENTHFSINFLPIKGSELVSQLLP